MRALMRIGIEKGAWAAAASLIFGGLIAMAATPLDSAGWLFGLASAVSGCAILVWALRLDNERWWRAALPFSTRLIARRSLYLARVVVSDSSLDTQSFFELTLVAFNGTRRKYRSTTWTGDVRMEFVSNGTITSTTNLGSPVMFFETERPHRPDQEFMTGARLFMNAAQIAEYRRREKAGETPRLMFSNLLVALETGRGRHRLPLWSGVNLSRGQFSGRVSTLEIQSAISATASSG